MGGARKLPETAALIPPGPDRPAPLKHQWLAWLPLGPGLLVCLADTDAGCLVVAAQSGARWGYSLLLLQVVLIPILFLAQELTIRLGVHTQQGHTACIREKFGNFWAWFACAFLVLECVGAMTSEMSGIAAVAELWGLSRIVATIIAACTVIFTVLFCSYKQVETVGVVCGLFECIFVFTMFWFHPAVADVLRGTFTFHGDTGYLTLIAANIGAVIMPWMIYFQQSAVVARRLSTHGDYLVERKSTLFGSVLTQLIMIGTLVTLAAARHVSRDLETVSDIAFALEPVLGLLPAKVVVSCGFVGGSLCGALVVSLAAAWAVCEACGRNESFSLDAPPTGAPAFYGCFALVVLLGVAILLMGVDIVKLNLFVELMDGLLMPVAVGFLYVLATCEEVLPPEVRVTGFHKLAVALLFGLCSALSLFSAFYGLVAG